MISDDFYDNIGVYIKQNYVYNYDSFIQQFGWATSIFEFSDIDDIQRSRFNRVG